MAASKFIWYPTSSARYCRTVLVLCMVGHLGSHIHAHTGSVVKRQTDPQGNNIKEGYVQTHGGTGAGNNCVFPFTFGSQQYYACICSFSEQPWCGTSANVDKDGKWGHCIQNNKNNAVFKNNPIYSSPGKCFLPFRYPMLFNMKIESCTCLFSWDWPWCSTTANYHMWSSLGYSNCAITACPPGYCKNGGTCKVVFKKERTKKLEPNFMCNCTKDYTGPLCEEDANEMRCGESVIPHRIKRLVGGEEANPHSWPWQVSLSMVWYSDGEDIRGSHNCGGSVINRQWIITAAHCMFRDMRKGILMTNDSLMVTVGVHSRRSTNETFKRTFKVDKIIAYPGWTVETIVNDIALVKLTENITYNDHVRPVCLPFKETVQLQECYLTGWGRLGGNLNMPDKLRQLKLKLLSKSDCFWKGYLSGKFSYVTLGKVRCFSIEKSGSHKGACYGDSGGPVNCKINNRWEMIGIASYMAYPGCTTGPSYYTDVVNYLPWLKKTMAEN